MEINLFKSISICLFILFIFSCRSKKCDCESYRDSLSKVTIAVKSLKGRDIEIRKIGDFCCSRKMGSDDWTCMLKSDAEIIKNYTGADNAEKYKKYNLGFIGLSIDVFNIKNINNLTKFELIVDSLNNTNGNRVNTMFFDQYPKSIYIEMIDSNGFLLKDGIQIEN